jgi:P2-related tail formation protein
MQAVAESGSKESKTERLKLTSQIATERGVHEESVAELEDQINLLKEKNRRDIATAAATNEVRVHARACVCVLVTYLFNPPTPHRDVFPELMH